MKIALRWENEAHTLVVWTFPNQWTWDDFFEARAVSDDMLRSVNHRVNLIADLTHSLVLPSGAIVTYHHSLQNAPRNTGTILVVGASALVRLMITTFNKIIPHSVPGADFVFAQSLDEAVALAAEQTIHT